MPLLETNGSGISGTIDIDYVWGVEREYTFFHVSDTHYGPAANAPVNAALIQLLNGLVAVPTAWPAALGGDNVGPPFCVFHTGDCVEGSGYMPQAMDDFYEDFVAGMSYDMKELIGNHDEYAFALMREIEARHNCPAGYRRYTVTKQNTVFICCDMWPGKWSGDLAWLASVLSPIGTKKRVAIFMHYGLDDWSVPTWWTQAEVDAFKAVIDGYNVVCILHGHWHWADLYEWEGIPVVTPGATPTPNYMNVVRITNDHIDAATYTWTHDGAGNWTGGNWLNSERFLL